MNVADGLADLKEPLVLLDGLLVLAEVVEKDTGRIVSATLISGLTSPLASEGQNVIVLESLLSSDPVVGVGVGHVEPAVVLKNTSCHLLSPIAKKG